jgi:rubrerythrin
VCLSKRIKELEEMVEILCIALAREKNSVHYYTEIYQKATTERARRMISTLLEEEKRHVISIKNHINEIQSIIDAERKKLK